MTQESDDHVIAAYKEMKGRAVALNAELILAKAQGGTHAQRDKSLELAETQIALNRLRPAYDAARARVHEAKMSKQEAQKVEKLLLFTIHHPVKGYRRLAAPGEPYETILLLAEERPEWGVTSYAAVPADEHMPDEWFELPVK
jgi:hypothetical protein